MWAGAADGRLHVNIHVVEIMWRYTDTAELRSRSGRISNGSVLLTLF